MKVVYITFPNKKSAKEIARLLLEKKLIACANIYAIDSLYTWKGEIADESEYVLWAKTNRENLKDIEKLVQANHQYEVPCIVNFDVEANSAYANWVAHALK
ncbi:MAG: divalent-cation tolerance protein CutA [Cytophagales bacterium]